MEAHTRDFLFGRKPGTYLDKALKYLNEENALFQKLASFKNVNFHYCTRCGLSMARCSCSIDQSLDSTLYVLWNHSCSRCGYKEEIEKSYCSGFEQIDFCGLSGEKHYWKEDVRSIHG
ncbi:MAG TPA: hypothetical protein VJK51_03860 [Candidatus Nanoarchaeia archaeon]|nr:hypothetical protein [Candidatus Nanoarchaeia archaeon]